MVLASALFVAFVCLVCPVAYLFPRKLRYLWLLACSALFYLCAPMLQTVAPVANPPGGVLPAGSTDAAVDFGTQLLARIAVGPAQGLPALAALLCVALAMWLCALLMQHLPGASGAWPQRGLLALALLASLGLLLWCRYLPPLLDWRSGLPAVGSLMPLGISFFCLTAAGYALDVYSGRVQAERNPLRVLFLLLFFPGLMVGPVHRAAQMMPQYHMPDRFCFGRVVGGLFRMLWGMFKRLVVAANLGLFTEAVLAGHQARSGPMLVLALLLLGLQLAVDFGGLSDIALGAAQMLGYRLAENVWRPFAAGSFTGLWRRWAMPLVALLQDYVIEPLQGLPLWQKLFGAKLQSNWVMGWLPNALGLVAGFVLLGLWCGPASGYVLWGLATGLLLALAGLYKARRHVAGQKVLCSLPQVAAAGPVLPDDVDVLGDVADSAAMAESMVVANDLATIQPELQKEKLKWPWPVRVLRTLWGRAYAYLLFGACLPLFAAGLYGLPLAAMLRPLGSGWMETNPAILWDAFAAPMRALPQHAALGEALPWVVLGCLLLVLVVEALASHPLLVRRATCSAGAKGSDGQWDAVQGATAMYTANAVEALSNSGLATEGVDEKSGQRDEAGVIPAQVPAHIGSWIGSRWYLIFVRVPLYVIMLVGINLFGVLGQPSLLPLLARWLEVMFG